MNIFVLDKDPTKAAQYMCDKHIPKMILETAQLLCSAYDDAPYKRTHYNHPCAVWTRQSQNNYSWLILHGYALQEEYFKRYGKRHKSFDVIVWCYENRQRLNIADLGLTSFALCMPDQYKVGDVVESYRQYYRLGKTFAKWDRLGNRPEWMDNNDYRIQGYSNI